MINKETGKSLIREFHIENGITYEIGPTKLKTLINTVTDLLISTELAKNVVKAIKRNNEK